MLSRDEMALAIAEQLLEEATHKMLEERFIEAEEAWALQLVENDLIETYRDICKKNPETGDDI